MPRRPRLLSFRVYDDGRDLLRYFLHAVEKTRDRRGVQGDDRLVFPPHSDYGYESTPRNALTFGDMGVDGVHYAILKIDGAVTDESPVIHVGPMDFSEPYVVLGDCFISRPLVTFPFERWIPYSRKSGRAATGLCPS
jgi:hypothetical protein